MVVAWSVWFYIECLVGLLGLMGQIACFSPVFFPDSSLVSELMSLNSVEVDSKFSGTSLHGIWKF